MLWKFVNAIARPFRLAQVKPMALGHGGCVASSMITIDGAKVGFMYREVPRNGIDGGWRFLAGSESPEYMGKPENHAVYDVNTISNYDPEIIPFLDAPAGAAFERVNGSGPFVEVHDFNPQD
jgi:hypothetical protein